MAEVTSILDSKRRHGASTEAVRAHNRGIVLNLIRRRQPVSRADLARQSGLQRSTISLIVEELVAESWVIEGPTGRLPRGRRPTFLRLNEKRGIIAVDVRPIQTTIGFSDVNGHFLTRHVFPTPADPAEGIQQIIAQIQQLIDEYRPGMVVEGIGISVAGRVEESSNKLIFAPNLRWVDTDLKGPIGAATGLPVDIENAANACALSTVWFDHVRDHRELVVVTVSEGLGTGVFANGRLVRGSQGMAGEFGHVPLDPQGPECTCGGHGCWEVFASNRAALRYYRELSSGGSVQSFSDLLTAADEGDVHAVAALEKMARYLGRGMRMIVAGLGPEQIVVVGDLTRSWHRFGPIIEAEVRAQTLAGATPAKVVASHEEGMARLRGTVALVLQKHFTSSN